MKGYIKDGCGVCGRKDFALVGAEDGLCMGCWKWSVLYLAQIWARMRFFIGRERWERP